MTGDVSRGIAGAVRHVRGLDTIRFVCALWVAIGHLGNPPLPEVIDKATTGGLLLRGIYNNLISAPAAVIVFFVISGICIHLPQATSNRIPCLRAFFVRRYARIVLPMFAAMLLAQHVFGVRLALLENSILWSLFAELVYYTIYPLLLFIRRAGISWQVLAATAFVIALGVASTNPTAGDYPSFGIGANWILGLPCWLIGCVVAEKIQTTPPLEPGQPFIWTTRALTWLSSSVCSMLRFHTPIGYPWTLNVFAIGAGFWILSETRFFAKTRPPALLEWGGTWSYSLYLAHPLAIASLKQFPMFETISLPLWIAAIVYVLSFSFLFACLFEFPSHKLARALARRVQKSAKPDYGAALLRSGE